MDEELRLLREEEFEDEAYMEQVELAERYRDSLRESGELFDGCEEE